MVDKEFELTTQEITVQKFCIHQNRFITISTDPFRNECERCYEKYLEDQKERLA